MADEPIQHLAGKDPLLCGDRCDAATSKASEAHRSDRDALESLWYAPNDDYNPSYKRQVPKVAFRIEDGWIVGASRGEFGGELAFIADSGSRTVIYRDNILDIFRLGERIVATAGRAHYAIGGSLLLIERDETGRFTVVPWRRLPAKPDQSWLTQSQELWINTYRAGTVLVDRHGNMRTLECPEQTALDRPPQTDATTPQTARARRRWL